VPGAEETPAKQPKRMKFKGDNYILISLDTLDEGQCATNKRKHREIREQTPETPKIWTIYEEICLDQGIVHPRKRLVWTLKEELVVDSGACLVVTREKKSKTRDSVGSEQGLCLYPEKFHRIDEEENIHVELVVCKDELWMGLRQSTSFGYSVFSPLSLEPPQGLKPKFLPRWACCLSSVEKMESQDWDMPRINRALRAMRSKLINLQTAVRTCSSEAQELGVGLTLAQMCDGGNKWNPVFGCKDLPPSNPNPITVTVPNLNTMVENMAKSSSIHSGALALFAHLHQSLMKTVVEPSQLLKTQHAKIQVWKRVLQHKDILEDAEWHRRKDYQSIISPIKIPDIPYDDVLPELYRIPKLSQLAALQLGASWSNLEVSNLDQKPIHNTLREIVRYASDDDLYDLIPDDYRSLVLFSHLSHLAMVHSPIIPLLFSMAEDLIECPGIGMELGWLLLRNALTVSHETLGVDVVAKSWQARTWEWIIALAGKFQKKEALFQILLDVFLDPFAVAAVAYTGEDHALLDVIHEEYPVEFSIEAIARCFEFLKLPDLPHKKDMAAALSRLESRLVRLVTTPTPRVMSILSLLMAHASFGPVPGCGITLSLLAKGFQVDNMALDELNRFMECASRDQQQAAATILSKTIVEQLPRKQRTELQHFGRVLSDWPALHQAWCTCVKLTNPRVKLRTSVKQPKTVESEDERVDFSSESEQSSEAALVHTEQSELESSGQSEEESEEESELTVPSRDFKSDTSDYETDVRAQKRRVNSPVRNVPTHPVFHNRQSVEYELPSAFIVVPPKGSSTRPTSQLASLFSNESPLSLLSINVPQKRSRKMLDTLQSTFDLVEVKRSPKSIWK
jgi:hypothetical protein